MRRILLLLLLTPFFYTLNAQEQGNNVTGQVFSRPDYLPLTGANAILVSSPEKPVLGATTDKQGKFIIRNVPAGNYTFSISFIGYGKVEKKISVAAGPLNMGVIYLDPENKDLGEVKVVGAAPLVNVKQDTTEYNADSYKVQPNAVAEDLVKKMPGLDVSNGTVKAQGESVKRVYVDGKQFFGDDPTLALRNLPAEVIDKVQLFQEMSDQSKVTGFDDGDRSTSLNIVTRRNMREGEIIKTVGGYGTDDRYTAGASVLRMKNNMRIAVLGASNNMNDQSFSMQDLVGGGGGGRGGFGGGGFMGGGGRGFGGPSGQAFQVSTNNGISTNYSGGLNFSNEWKKVKLSVSYFLNYTNTKNEDLTNRQYLQNDTSNTNYTEWAPSTKNNGNHRMYFRMEYAIDSFNTIMWRGNLNYQDNTQNSITDRQTFLGLTNLNNSSITLNNNRQGLNLFSFLMYSHTFKKPGRTISISTNVSNNDRPGETLRNSLTSYPTDTILSVQRVHSLTGSTSFSTNLAYTEPLGKIAQIMVNYSPNVTLSNSDRKTWDIFGNGQPDSLNTQLSNTFDNTYTTHRAGLNLRLHNNKLNFSFGVNGQEAFLSNKQVYPNELNLSKSFASVLPSAMVMWRAGKNSLMGFYNTYTNPPDVTQLQNVVDNSNPLSVTTGNPDLKQEYTHSLMVRYTGVKSTSMITFMGLIGGTYTKNTIADATTLYNRPDTIRIYGQEVPVGAGSSFTRPVNMTDPEWSVRSFLTLGIPITKLKFNLNFNSGINYSGTPGFLDNVPNTTRTTSLSEGMVIASNISEKVDFTLTGNLAYNIASYSSNPSNKTTYYTQRYGGKLHIILPGNFFLDGNVDYLLNKGLSDGYNVTYTLLNSSVGKYLLKNRSLEIRATAFDVLDQNNAINRTITESYIQDTRSLTLRRYYMVTLTYNFRNFAMPERKDDHDHPPMGPPGDGRRWMRD